MATPRRFLVALLLSLLPSPITPLSRKESLLLFGMLTVDRNVSSCTYLAARIEYTGTGFASFDTSRAGLDGEGSVDGGVEGGVEGSVEGGVEGSVEDLAGRVDVTDVAGTLVCPEQASSSSSTSYLITVPTSGAALEASPHGLVKLYGVQVAKGGPAVGFNGSPGDARPTTSLVAKQYVLVSTSDKKVSVDVDMTADGVPVDLFSRAFAASMDGIECRSIMRRAFGRTPEVVRWAGAWDARKAGDLPDAVGRCAAAGHDEPACCSRRPTMACAGIGVGAVLVLWLVFASRSSDRLDGGVGRDPARPRKAEGAERALRETRETRTMRDRVSPNDVSTPDKTTDVREWKREGDRLRRDIKRQSADPKKPQPDLRGV